MASISARITTPFTADFTADDVLAGIDLTGKRAIVTGVSSGLGVETARALASAGAEVTLEVRDTSASKRIATDITATTSNTHGALRPRQPRIHHGVYESVERPAAHPGEQRWNRGAPELTRTPEGWEQQFTTNHMDHFELTLGLHDALAAAGNARIVSVSSRSHRRVPIVFDDIHFENLSYSDVEAYGQSKTANVLFAVEASDGRRTA